MKKFNLILLISFIQVGFSQTDSRIYDIINSVSTKRIESDIKTLANFGTRNTFSDTISNKRGIGAARRWIKSEFEKVSKECSNCLEVFYQKDFVTTNIKILGEVAAVGAFIGATCFTLSFVFDTNLFTVTSTNSLSALAGLASLPMEGLTNLFAALKLDYLTSVLASFGSFNGKQRKSSGKGCGGLETSAGQVKSKAGGVGRGVLKVMEGEWQKMAGHGHEVPIK